MKKREDVLGKLVTVEAQPKVFGSEDVVLCPLCEESEFVEIYEWNQTDGEMEAVCACKRCNIAFSAWFNMNYVEHSSICELDEN